MTSRKYGYAYTWGAKLTATPTTTLTVLDDPQQTQNEIHITNAAAQSSLIIITSQFLHIVSEHQI
jgi:hypothetical protein